MGLQHGPEHDGDVPHVPRLFAGHDCGRRRLDHQHGLGGGLDVGAPGNVGVDHVEVGGGRIVLQRDGELLDAEATLTDERIEAAVGKVLEAGLRTPDIASVGEATVGTIEMAAAVRAALV